MIKFIIFASENNKSNMEGCYYYENDPYFGKIIVIEINKRRWMYASVVLSALERMMKSSRNYTLDVATELEKNHWEGTGLSELTNEFEILKQTPEYKMLMELYG